MRYATYSQQLVNVFRQEKGEITPVMHTAVLTKPSYVLVALYGGWKTGFHFSLCPRR